jgi:hypothetical protein
MGGEIKVAVVCSSNQNRSMVTKKGGFIIVFDRYEITKRGYLPSFVYTISVRNLSFQILFPIILLTQMISLFNLNLTLKSYVKVGD